MTARSPSVSVIVIVHDMAREAPRTLRSLSPAYQQHLAADDYEIIVVDNGSTVPLDVGTVTEIASNARLIRLEPAPPSPAAAINRGLAEARGEVIGVMVDGARLATPGLLHFARHGAALYETAIVAALGWYLGSDLQGWAVQSGYDAAREDALLASIAWPEDGYRLFEIGTMDESSVDGWFAPIAESNALFLHRSVWEKLGGADERFTEPGGGLLNLDTFRRALDLPGAQLVLLLGEATFHQMHGGVNTNVSPAQQAHNAERSTAEYAELRGRPWEIPYATPTYVGTLPRPALSRMVRAAIHPARPDSSALGNNVDAAAWTPAQTQQNGTVGRLVALAAEALREGHPAASCGVARIARALAPDHPDVLRILALTGSSAPSSEAPPKDVVRYHLALGQAHRIIGHDTGAESHFRSALALDPNATAAHLALAQMRMPGDDYLVWIDRLYQALEPASVLEIGVFEGASLRLVRPPAIAIGVDPAPRILHPLAAETHIFPEASDVFFANGRARALLADRPLSIGFIDGLHLFEQALRDFINLEALCGPDSVILLHDTIPLDEATSAREQRTAFHTGDVWKTILCLKHYRPELRIVTIATPPSGLTIVTSLDPSNRALVDHYDEAVARFIEVPFSAVEDGAASAFNVVANEWASVEPLLAARAWMKATSAEVPARDIPRDGEASGNFVVDRDQPRLSTEERAVVDRFHALYYGRWQGGADTINASWFGYLTLKCPLDLWLYQELLVRRRPDLVVECGTWCGGASIGPGPNSRYAGCPLMFVSSTMR